MGGSIKRFWFGRLGDDGVVVCLACLRESQAVEGAGKDCQVSSFGIVRRLTEA